MDYAVQFVKHYNRNSKTTKIISRNGQERSITLSIDALRNAYALDVIMEPYVDLRKLGNKLEGATTYKATSNGEVSDSLTSHLIFRRWPEYSDCL